MVRKMNIPLISGVMFRFHVSFGEGVVVQQIHPKSVPNQWPSLFVDF